MGFLQKENGVLESEESRINISQRKRAPMGGEIGKFSL